MSDAMNERLLIRELVENWAVWRDAGDWDRFRGVWHPEGQMWATWFQGSFEDFIRVSREGFAKGVRILHFLGGSSIDLALDLDNPRAIAQTKMTISQRAMVHDVEVDVVCTGRFYDFLEKRDGKWGLVLRRLAYEKDRMDPVDPAATLKLDPALLGQFPVGYKHLAYLQASIGYDVKKDMAGLTGPEVEALYAKGKGWLQGKPAL
ncbi:MAG: nuclear transport factor 2 family protein [Hyphomicrobiaceae bacterium]